jgi:hypothetical protein
MSRQFAERIVGHIWKQLESYHMTHIYRHRLDVDCLKVDSWKKLFSEESDEDQKVIISMTQKGKHLSGIHIYYSGRVYFVLAPIGCFDEIIVSEEDVEMKELSKNVEVYVKTRFPQVAVQEIIERHQNPRYMCEVAWPHPANGQIEVRIFPNTTTYGMKVYDHVYGIIDKHLSPNPQEDVIDYESYGDGRYIWTHINIECFDEFLKYIDNSISFYNPTDVSELSNEELIQELESFVSLGNVFGTTQLLIQELRKRLS